VLKVVIVFLLIGVLLSLFSGLAFLFKDTGQPDSRRTLRALGVRITLAAALLLTVFYGLYTGRLQFATNAPWHRSSAPSSVPEANTPAGEKARAGATRASDQYKASDQNT
jgi:hypothetical protein